MKIYVQIFIALLISFELRAQNKQKVSLTTADSPTPFLLTIAAQGFRDSTIAVIVNPADRQYKGPSGYVRNGAVTLKGALPEESMYVIILTDGENQNNNVYYSTFLSNEHGSIIFHKNNNQITVEKGNTLKIFQSLLQTLGNDFDTLTIINQQKQTAHSSGASLDSLNQAFESVKQKIKKKLPAFLTDHAANIVASYILYIAKPLLSLEETESNYNILQYPAQQSAYGTAVQEYIQTEKITGQGQPAPVFTQNDTAGKPVSLTDFKGKYVLVHFWASWCGSCRMENPHIVQVYNTYKNKNFAVLGISLDKAKNNWLAAIKEDHLTWTHVSDLKFWQNEVAKQYRVSSIPQSFLIDPQGKIVAKNLKGGLLDAYLKDLLDNH